MMIWMAVCAIFTFLQIFRSFTVESAITGILMALFDGYLFVVLYSLYDKFKQEHERSFSAQYYVPGRKV